MTVRDFDAMLAEKRKATAQFKLGGQVFTLRRKLSAARWFAMLATMRSDDIDVEDANRQFFSTVIKASDRERFLAMYEADEGDDDDGDVVDIALVNDLVNWAMEYYTGKPVDDSSSSSPGASETGPPPNVVSLTARTTAS